MAIKNIPINCRGYYNNLKADYVEKIDVAQRDLEKAKSDNKEYYSKLTNNKSNYKKYLNLDSFEEFNSNKHIDGSLKEKATKIYRNCTLDEDVVKVIDIVKYANSIENIKTLTRNIEIYTKLANISYDDFRNFLKKFYYEVQRQMIVNGYGYKIANSVGTVCINRCKNVKAVHILDTKATRANEKKLREEGKEIFDKKKAEYYKKHNLKYEGVDPKIYKVNNYLYEFCLIYSGLNGKYNHKFEPFDYWAPALRGKTKEDFIAEAKGNLSYITNLDITFRTKISICNEIDETLYLKFIRNATQSPITTTKTHRESR